MSEQTPYEMKERILRLEGALISSQAENDRLREALEKIAGANWLDDPHEARRIAKVATAKEAGK